MSAAETFERLNQISRTRALTDKESKSLWESMRAMGRKPRTARAKAAPKAQPQLGGWSWSYDDDAKFFDAIADGMPIAEAGRLVGKNNAASQGRFSRARKVMGWQAS